jgi:hypothetical protein
LPVLSTGLGSGFGPVPFQGRGPFRAERFSTMFFIDDEPGSKPPKGIMAEWLGKFLPTGARPAREYHGPRFQGREMPVNDQLDAIARRDARMAGLNKPVPVTVAGMVEAVVAAAAPECRLADP